jgi:hypothetical protein
LVGGAFPVDSASDRARILGGTVTELFGFERVDGPSPA